MLCISRTNNSAPPQICRAPELLRRRGVDSVQSLFERAVNSSDRLVGSRSRESAEQFHQARLVRIACGAFAIWLDPFGMLDPQIVVNLLPELAVGMDLVKHGNWLGEPVFV
jgi:hypothetical protein